MKLNEAIKSVWSSLLRSQRQGGGQSRCLESDMHALEACSPRVYTSVCRELRELGVSTHSQPQLNAEVFRLLSTAIRDGHAARLKHLEFMCGVADVLEPAIASVRTHFRVQGNAYGAEWSERVSLELQDLSLVKNGCERAERPLCPERPLRMGALPPSAPALLSVS